MSPQSTVVAAVIGRLASRQHGVVTRSQLLDAGITTHEIRHRVRSGALLREHPGVYRAGHRAPSVEATYLAAVFAGGDQARLSGRAAAHLLGLLKGPVPRPEVTTPLKRRVDGVTVRRGRIDPPDRATCRGVPVTSVPRTLTDLAADLSLDALARACHEAGVRYATTPAHVAAVLARRPKTKGAAKLRLILHGDARVTLSALERRFLELLREHGLPLPRTNRPAGGHRVDCDGRSGGSPSSSTATASTTRATRGSRTDAASAMRAPAATSTGATPGPTSSRSAIRCWPSSAASSLDRQLRGRPQLLRHTGRTQDAPSRFRTKDP